MGTPFILSLLIQIIKPRTFYCKGPPLTILWGNGEEVSAINGRALIFKDTLDALVQIDGADIVLGGDRF